VDQEKPYRSFVLQELDLQRLDSDLQISALVLDSAQYERAPTLIPQPPISYNAGISGNMLADQTGLAEQWLAMGSAKNRMTILIVHHPYAVLTELTQKVIDGFRQNYRVPLYISGHTHHGEYFVRGGDNGWLELNVGSTVDWPIEFRTFEIHRIEADPDHLIFRTPLFRIPDIWDRAAGVRKPVCKADQWEVKETDAKDFYLAHNYKSSPSPDKTQKELLVALLITYKRMLPVVASAADNTVWPPLCTSDEDVLNKIDDVLNRQDMDEMTGLLVALEEFETHRKPLDPKAQRDYCLCQTVWASKYDKLKGRKPVTADPYIRFPKGASGGK
jgi:hypothetical protein